jgi:hypothetical protein
MTEGDKNETPPVEKAIEKLKEVEADLAKDREAEARDERKLEEAVEELREAERHEYHLKVNRVQHTWPHEKINGAEIKRLAGSPADWVVNQTHDGPGEDPEILDDQYVDLAKDAPPKGEKTFTTRKPKTSPGA